jgi:hypothetical protein
LPKSVMGILSKQTYAPSSRKDAGTRRGSRSLGRSSQTLTLSDVGLFFRVMCSGHSSKWTLAMALQCRTSTSAPWKMGSNTCIRMWAFSEWPCRWTTVWGLTAPSCTYM